MQIGLTSIPAISPDNGGDGEYNKVQYILSSLDKMDFKNIIHINAPDGRVS
jgi:succinyl-diaminopimelate desuccinylase